jgi:hypothetical protein
MSCISVGPVDLDRNGARIDASPSSEVEEIFILAAGAFDVIVREIDMRFCKCFRF